MQDGYRPLDVGAVSAAGSKGLVDVCILEILSDTTRSRTLTQRQIGERLEEGYGIRIDRKTLRRHLSSLSAGVAGVRCREERRGGAAVLTDFWMERDTPFDESEIAVLIYGVIFSRHMPRRCKKDLVRKLESLSPSGYSRDLASYISEDSGMEDDHSELFWNVEALSRAIAERRKVSFRYSQYRFDGTVEVSDRVCTVSPFGIGERDGDLYLVGALNGVSGDSTERFIEHLGGVIEAIESGEARMDVFRLDRIRGVEELEEAREPLGRPGSLRLRGVRGDAMNVWEYARENPTLSPGHAVRARLRLADCGEDDLSDAIDFFGRGSVRIEPEGPRRDGGRGPYVASVRASIGAVREFAMRKARCVEVLEPESLRNELVETYRAALGRMLPPDPPGAEGEGE